MLCLSQTLHSSQYSSMKLCMLILFVSGYSYVYVTVTCIIKCVTITICVHCTVALFSDSLLHHPRDSLFFLLFFKHTNWLSAHTVCLISPCTGWHSVTHRHTCTLCQQYHPCKHAGSGPDQGGSIGQKRAGCFLHTGLLPDRIRLAKTWYGQN